MPSASKPPVRSHADHGGETIPTTEGVLLDAARFAADLLRRRERRTCPPSVVVAPIMWGPKVVNINVASK